MGEELDMNFFFLNEDLKDVEKNIDRQLSLARSVADKLKIKYDDIMGTSPKNIKDTQTKIPDSASLQINQEPSVEDVFHRSLHMKRN